MIIGPIYSEMSKVCTPVCQASTVPFDDGRHCDCTTCTKWDRCVYPPGCTNTYSVEYVCDGQFHGEGEKALGITVPVLLLALLSAYVIVLAVARARSRARLIASDRYHAFTIIYPTPRSILLVLWHGVSLIVGTSLFGLGMSSVSGIDEVPDYGPKWFRIGAVVTGSAFVRGRAMTGAVVSLLTARL